MPKLREADFARPRAYDWRAALLLIQQGITEFATVNEKDFRKIQLTILTNLAKFPSSFKSLSMRQKRSFQG